MPAPTENADGDVIDFTGTLLEQRAVEVDIGTIHALQFDVESTGEQILVVWDTAEFSLELLQTGQKYTLTSVQYSDLPSTAAVTAETCPNCNNELRDGVAVDRYSQPVRNAVSTLELDEPFAIATAQTQFIPRARDAVDDWVPMRESHRRHPTPAFVCEECGATYDQHDLHPPTRERRGEGSERTRSDAVADLSAINDNQLESESIGLATGGTKDVANFRENIETGYTPQPGAISTEGLFYDYYFETGNRVADTDALFAPEYAAGVSAHPISGETERYLAVGLDSTLTTADFERPRLDLVAVLDVSGSMDSPFDTYYYDEQRRRQSADAGSERKIEAATSALCALTEQLREGDRLGVVLYNNRAHVAKPLRAVQETDMDAIRQHIRNVAAGGGTNMEDGFAAAWDLLQDGPTEPETERRVVFMTDMMPNIGETGESELRKQFEAAAAEGIHTTFIGIGLDENTDLADAVSTVRGANHYFVHSVESFERRVGEEFAYMVTPLVYDLRLELESDDCEVTAVHGAPEADDDQLLHVPTLFPSPTTDGETRGGVVLVELDGPADADIDLVASWNERDGSTHSERLAVELPASGPTYDHDGVRKAVLLARYATTLRAWASDVHARETRASGVDDWIAPDPTSNQEREAVPLRVSESHARRFKTFRAHLVAEADALDDEALSQEVSLLERLCEEAGVDIQPTVDPAQSPD